MAHERETQALGRVAGRLSWDQETVMPRGAVEQRAEEMGAMQAMMHARKTDPRIGEWLEDARAPDEAGAAQLRLIGHQFGRLTRVPADLTRALASLTSRSQAQWAAARAEDDFAGFAPTLEEVVRLKREQGAALADGGDVYDALIDDYEPGASAAELAAIFDEMRPGLVELRLAALQGAEHPPVSGQFAPEVQVALARELAERFGYDLNRGRIDMAVHPFSSGSGDDVRITTRVSESDPFNCLYSTIHEVGHACYEQAIDPAYALTPLGQGVSMGVHESQSRIYENQLGRGEAFCGWLFHGLSEAFGDIGIADAASFYRAANRVHPGFVRT